MLRYNSVLMQNYTEESSTPDRFLRNLYIGAPYSKKRTIIVVIDGSKGITTTTAAITCEP